MPGSLEYRKLRDLLHRESLDQLVRDEGLARRISSRGGLLEIVDELLPDLDRAEREWLEQMPTTQREAVRAVIEDVAATEGVDLELQFAPAYDYSVQVYDFDATVVVRAHGPYTGQPSARETFKAFRSG